MELTPHSTRHAQVADRGSANVAERCGESLIAVEVHAERMAVAVVGASKGLRACAHHDARAADVGRLAEIHAAVGLLCAA